MTVTATLSQLAAVLSASLVNIPSSRLSQVIVGIQTDTRVLQPGEVFLALGGERFNGHQFVETAIARGAVAAIVDYTYDHPDLPVIKVSNTLRAYQELAKWWRGEFGIPIIGVTGSVGKTTTKELIAAVLGTRGKVHKTYGNFNNEIGVPKTLLELSQGDDFAVIEMAMRGKGQIAELTHIAKPSIGVITNVGTAHIELLGSEQAIAEAKCELLTEMPNDSIAILNYDSPLLMAIAKQLWSGKVISYGFTGGDIQGRLLDYQKIEVEGMTLPVPLAGVHNGSNFLAALAVAKVLGVDWKHLQAGINVTMPKGRSQSWKLPRDIMILDETYNAAPEAMLAALELLAQTPGKRKIAVLGAMKELGERSTKLHQQVGETVKKLNLDGLLVLVDGPDAETIVTSAQGIPCERCHNHSDLVSLLKTYVQPGDRLLFKAAHSVGLEKVVQQFCGEINS